MRPTWNTRRSSERSCAALQELQNTMADDLVIRRFFLASSLSSSFATTRKSSPSLLLLWTMKYTKYTNFTWSGTSR